VRHLWSVHKIDDSSPTRDGSCGCGIDEEKRYAIHNQTPMRIKVHSSDGGEIELPPLAERVICGYRVKEFSAPLWRLRQRHQVRLRPYPDPQRKVRFSVALGWLTVLLAGVVVFDILQKGTLFTWEALSAAALTAIVAALVLHDASTRETDRRNIQSKLDWTEGDIVPDLGDAYYDGNETLRRAKHLLTLATVVIVGAVLPTIAIFVATDAKDFLVMKGGLRVYSGKESRLVSRVIQVTYTAVLALFPALLYFQFDRQRVGTIRSGWIRAIFRMDRRMTTLSDVDARYGDEMSEASTNSTDSVRLLGGRHSPIVVATILISLGWTLLVIRTESFDFAGAAKVSTIARSADAAAQRAQDAASDAADGKTTPADAAAAASSAADQAAAAGNAAAEVANSSTGVTVVPTPTTASGPTGTDPAATGKVANAATGSAATAAAAESAIDRPFFQILVSDPSAATMAFLGAYFFAVYLVLRGYFRGDLRPKIYNQITARLVTVVVIAYLINVLFSRNGNNTYLLILSFLAGVVPTTVLQQMFMLAGSCFPSLKPDEAAEKKGLRRAIAQAFATPRVLTHIDGVDLQEANQLESEGYPDVTSLARSDLVSVMVNTRLPIGRLIDWADQAVLILLLDDGIDDVLDERVTKLRHIGLRTASDVLEVADGTNAAAQQAVEKILSDGGGGLDLASLASLIRHEPAMDRIRQWYASELADVTHPWPTIEEWPDGDHPATIDLTQGNGHQPPMATAGTAPRANVPPLT
jgi:hypothetical protein